MNKLKFLFLSLFVSSIIISSCGDDDEPDTNTLTGISINNSTLSIEEGETATLIATLAPLDATGSVSWSSSDESVATVDNAGEVTAVSEGSATVVASVSTFTASCEVTVTKEVIEVDDESLNGSDYYVVQIDETSYNTISDRVVQDFRPDDETRFLYIWDGTFNGGNSVGTNFYGLDETWVNLSVGNIGWSGGGYFVSAESETIDMTRMFDNPEDYYLHIGLKTGQSASSFLFILNDGISEAKIAIGGDYDDNGTVFPEYTNITRDNEWNSIEIPVSYLNELGLYYNETFQDVNILAFLAGGTEGTTLDMDAVFFYKKG